MVLLETGELLLYKDAATVIEVVSREILNASETLSPDSAHLLNVPPLFGIHEAYQAHGEHKPEGAILHEIHVPIIVHRVRRSRQVEVILVANHKCLEFHGILRVHCLRVRVVEVEEVVEVGLMELAGATHGRAS